jgi:hypothetical protein
MERDGFLLVCLFVVVVVVVVWGARGWSPQGPDLMMDTIAAILACVL